MSWKIKTDPETPFIFTPGGSGTGGNLIPFDIEGLAPGDWWLSAVADLGPSPRTAKFWWQAKSALSASGVPVGSYLSFYAATADDNDVTNIDGLNVGSGVTNYLINGQDNQISSTCSPNGIPPQVIANTWNTGCGCLTGPFTLNYDASQQLWTSGPISGCPGAFIPAFAQFNCSGFGFAASGSTIGDSNTAFSSGNVISQFPFAASGNGWTSGNTNLWCFSNTINWLVQPTNQIPIPANLQFIGALVTDGTGGSGVPNVTSGYVELPARYLYLLAYNGTTYSLSSLGSDHQFYLLPVPDEVQ